MARHDNVRRHLRVFRYEPTNPRIGRIIGAFDDKHNLIVGVILLKQREKIGIEIEVNPFTRREQSNMARGTMLCDVSHAASRIATVLPRQQRQEQRLDNHQSSED